ncbi:hypothetical protein LCGC14_1501860 [marine sediment metagenome]|uniref:Uncharacterized protein n=1 Tax=marine sediment metagenome TaxID=412755 RepID=A0A0F9J4C4_9ZZZZ
MVIVNKRSTEVGEKTYSLDHNIGEGKSLIIGMRDETNNQKVLLDLTAEEGETIQFKATITIMKV